MNMISEKYNKTQAERVQYELEQRNRETMTQVKIENALLCQQNTELKNDVKESEEEIDNLRTKLYLFKDLDMDRVALATSNYD